MVYDRLDYPLDDLVKKNSKTKGIDIKSLRPIGRDRASLARALNLPVDKIEKIDDWYTLGSDYYFVKIRILVKNVLNELLGEYLSDYMDLATIHYNLLLDSDRIIGVVSRNFRDREVKYVKANELSDAEHKSIKRVLRSRPSIFNIKQKRPMYNYLARNFYANQVDRMDNVLCYYRSASVFLAQLYDYECSMRFPNDRELVDPFFIDESITPTLLARLSQFDKNMLRAIEKVMLFDMRQALDDIASAHNIVIPNDVKDDYLEYDEKRKALIEERIIRRVK